MHPCLLPAVSPGFSSTVTAFRLPLSKRYIASGALTSSRVQESQTVTRSRRIQSKFSEYTTAMLPFGMLQFRVVARTLRVRNASVGVCAQGGHHVGFNRLSTRRLRALDRRARAASSVLPFLSPPPSSRLLPPSYLPIPAPAPPKQKSSITNCENPPEVRRMIAARS